MPELIIKEDGDRKNDCERNASKRLYQDFKREHPHMKVIVVEDCLASNFPHLDELKRLDMQFIIGAKPGDHQALFKWVDEQECYHYEHTTEDGVTHRYRYINDAPLSKSHGEFKIKAHYGFRGLMRPTVEPMIPAMLSLSFLHCVQTQKIPGKSVIFPEKFLCVV